MNSGTLCEEVHDPEYALRRNLTAPTSNRGTPQKTQQIIQRTSMMLKAWISRCTEAVLTRKTSGLSLLNYRCEMVALTVGDFCTMAGNPIFDIFLKFPYKYMWIGLDDAESYLAYVSTIIFQDSTIHHCCIIMDGVNAAASVLAVIQVSAKVCGFCHKYYLSLQDARKQVRRLSYEMPFLHDVLENLMDLHARGVNLSSFRLSHGSAR